jgi:hypothetical protein
VLISTWFSSAIAQGVEGAQETALFQAVLASAGMIVLALGSRLLMSVVRRKRAAQRTTPT